ALRRARRGSDVTTACAGQQFVHGFILPKDSRTAQGKTGNWTRETADRHGTLAALPNPKAFAAWLGPLFRSKWVVYSKRPFGGAQHALRYLGQYTHRVAISNRQRRPAAHDAHRQHAAQGVQGLHLGRRHPGPVPYAVERPPARRQSLRSSRNPTRHSAHGLAAVGGSVKDGMEAGRREPAPPLASSFSMECTDYGLPAM